MNLRGKTIVADLTWTGLAFERDVSVRVGQDGKIEQVSRDVPHDAERLEHLALLPGMTCAHSHAFQRALRFRPERFNTGSGNFWTWRETMYRLVDELDEQSVYEISRNTFAEMLRCGVTSVGEFHYVHHGSAPWSMDAAVLSAARDAGIRTSLIQCYYATGGVDQPLDGAQKKFAAVSMPDFLLQFERLEDRLDAATQSLALSAHSIRGASIDDIAHLHELSLAAKIPFHIHVEEQPREIEDCVRHYGKRPLRLLLDRLKIDRNFTAIHCTHSTPDDLRELASRGGRGCLCPSTEGNLADGIPGLRDMRQAGMRLCMGSDCNLRISMNEDLRWLEFVSRVSSQSSGIVVDEHGDPARALFEIATTGGAESLGLNRGAIGAGRQADLFALNLRHPSLIGCTPEGLLHAFIFGCGNGPVDRVWVGGSAVHTR
ncbi:MAG: formimidoylglutamate deiminase [Tepidisphaeraceae bacterium]